MTKSCHMAHLHSPQLLKTNGSTPFIWLQIGLLIITFSPLFLLVENKIIIFFRWVEKLNNHAFQTISTLPLPSFPSVGIFLYKFKTLLVYFSYILLSLSHLILNIRNEVLGTYFRLLSSCINYFRIFFK